MDNNGLHPRLLTADASGLDPLQTGLLTPVATILRTGLVTLVIALPFGTVCRAVETADTDIARMRSRVDQLLSERWAEEDVEPACECTDNEFLRRAYLDLIGRIPRVSEVRDFFADEPGDRRHRLIDDLVNRPGHATHLANVWRRFLLPEGADLERFGGIAGFETWLRARFAESMTYDQIVRELLLAEGDASQSGPALFYTAWELKTEKLAASTSRAFLGVQLQCAECHDHPFDRWTQRDFWGYAAFFARLKAANGSAGPVVAFRERGTGEATLPETEEVVMPRYLGDEQATHTGPTSRRKMLADWMVSQQNPYFARAAVNRIWAHLFARGLVNPPDDMGQHNPASHPQLLEELADFFRQSGFDLRVLVRALAGTRAYQLSSEPNQGVSRPPELFAQMAVKTLTAEQLYDSLHTATCRLQPPQLGGPTFGINRVLDRNRQTFLAGFRTPTSSTTEYQLGIQQALTLMNGDFTTDATNLERSDLLVSLTAPFFSEDERLETLFLAALARKPTEAERERFMPYVAGQESDDDKQAALGDVLWALVNSAEFALVR